MRGRDIKQNGYEWARLYCICTFPAAHVNIEEYPAIEKWFKDANWSDEVPAGDGQLKLEQTGIKHSLNGKSFQSRKKTGNKWFETQDQIAYMDDFDKQKILYSEIVRSPQFYLDNQKFVPEATTFIISGKHLDVLVQFLNSPLIAWVFKTFYAGGGLGEDGFRYKKQFFINLPLPKVFNTKISNNTIKLLYHLTDEEMNFISSSVKK